MTAEIWSKHLSARYALALVGQLARERGDGATDQVLAALGVDRPQLRAHRWVSVEFTQDLVEGVAAASSGETVIRAAEHMVQGADRTLLRAVLRTVTTPHALYRRLPELTRTWDRVGQVTVLEQQPGRALVQYRTDVPWRTPLVCRARRAQLATVPTLWGRPAARVTTHSCQCLGGDACRYELTWTPTVSHVTTLAGTAIGVAGAIAGVAATGEPLWAMLAAVGLAGGLAWRQTLSAYAIDTGRRYERAVQEKLLATVHLRVGELHAEQERRRAVEAERQRLQEQAILDDRLGRVALLARGLAHRLNNPLAALSGNLEYAIDELTDYDALDEDDREEARAALADSLAEARRLERMVRDLHLFSQLRPTHLDDISPGAALDSALTLVANELKHRGRLERGIAPTGLVRADPARLAQVFLNLLMNAIQALPLGHVMAHRVGVALREVDGQIVLEITDDGEGIPAANLGRIFEPFFTTRSPGEGIGLGLTHASSLVEELGGTLAVESVEGQGTTARVTLPVSAPDEATIPRKETTMPAGSARILVIDDERPILRVFQRTLRQHDVTTLASAAQALALLEADARWDVVFCDLMMPEVSGAEFHERVQELHPELAPRIVFMSGGVFAPDMEAYLAPLPNHHLDKPIERELLFSTLAQVLAS